MRRFNYSAIKKPCCLTGSESPGIKERNKAVEFYSLAENSEKPFKKFKAYKDNEVKLALNNLFHFKCAYCESIYGATQPVDIEHYRPKGGVIITNRLRKPGYYWLASEWKNLLPSCIDCNRRRTQEIPNMEPSLAGKANLFPIVKETDRASIPGEEKKEKRLLLHPCLDFPEKHFEFINDGLVIARKNKNGRVSHKGKVTIETLGLQRKGLNQVRRDRLLLIKEQITRVKRIMERINQYPDDLVFDIDLKEEMRILHRYTENNQPYSAMAKQFIERFLKSI